MPAMIEEDPKKVKHLKKTSPRSIILSQDAVVTQDKKIETKFTIQRSKLIRNTVFADRPHIIVPVCMITEGVHNQVLYTNEELSKFPQAWDGEPIPNGHPVRNGKPVSANRPDILEEEVVGRLFNTAFQVKAGQGRLLSEAWIDPDRADNIEPKIMEKFNAEELMEVSTAMYIDSVAQVGSWNGEDYTEIATNIRPDHLALLPSGIGACSIEDGGGAPRNNAQDDNNHGEPLMIVLGSNLSKIAEGVAITTNELSHSQIWETLSTLIREKEGMAEKLYVWIKEVYNGYLIYSVERDEKVVLFKQAYSVDAATDAVSLGEDRVEVKQTVTYTVSDSKQGGGIIPPQVGGSSMERKDQIDLLVSNGKVVEAAREGLMALSETEFFAKVIEVSSAPKATEPPVTIPESKINSVDQLATVVTGEALIVINEGLNLRKECRETVITTITANAKNKFTPEELVGKSTAELKKLEALMGSPAAETPTVLAVPSFLGNAGSSGNGDSEVKPLVAPRLFEESEESK